MLHISMLVIRMLMADNCTVCICSSWTCVCNKSLYNSWNFNGLYWWFWRFKVDCIVYICIYIYIYSQIDWDLDGAIHPHKNSFNCGPSMACLLLCFCCFVLLVLLPHFLFFFFINCSVGLLVPFFKDIKHFNQFEWCNRIMPGEFS